MFESNTIPTLISQGHYIHMIMPNISKEYYVHQTKEYYQTKTIARNK